MHRQSDSSFSAAFYSAGLLFFSLCIAIPCTLYLTNAREFSITLADLLLVAGTALALALAATALLLRYVAFLKQPRFVAFLFALAALVWLQGNILVWQYGPLDGRTIDWTRFRLNGVIDSAIWLLVLAAALWKPPPFYKAARTIAPALIAMQAVWLFFAGGAGKSEDVGGTIKAYTLDGSRKYTFSDYRNAVLIVLDETQSNIFSEIVDSDATYRDIFQGFTYFPDALAGANYTELAIPALLTGRLFDNSVPKDQYLKRTFLSDSVFAVLKRAQFRVDIFPWIGWGNESVYFDDTIADNLRRQDGTVSNARSHWTEKKIKEIVHLADLTLFRSAPHFLKPYIYDDQKWFLIQIISNFVPDTVKVTVSTHDQYETIKFGEDAVRELRAEHSGPAFKYYHLKGNHGPLTATADLNVTTEPVPYTRDNYILQMKTSLRGLDRFLSGLRRLNVFDQTLIVIVGDHGSGMADGLYLNSTPHATARVTTNSPVPARKFIKDKARGVPLVLIKRIGAAGPMRVSETPVSLLDLPTTIASELGLPVANPDLSMFRVGPLRERTRMYGAIDMTAAKANFVGDIVLYSVNGNSWQDSSWTISNVLSPPAADQ